jgi:hypothetical protein
MWTLCPLFALALLAGIPSAIALTSQPAHHLPSVRSFQSVQSWCDAGASSEADIGLEGPGNLDSM